MKKRKLGKNDFLVSEIGFGCMGLNHDRGPAKDRSDMIRLVHKATDLGISLFDTAEVYGPYTNEELVGEALAGRRQNIKLTTKGGFDVSTPELSLDSRPEKLINSIEGSLKRLRTDYIDLYYIHRVDPKVPIEIVAEAMGRMIKEGKILHWGLSEANAETIRKAHLVQPITAIQSEYSIWWREQEKEVLPLLEELGIGFVAYSPLGRGFLTGKLSTKSDFSTNDNRGKLPRFQKEAMLENQKLLDFLSKIAESKGATLAQVSIAWVLKQNPWIVPIPGTTKESRLKENIQASEITFTDAEMKMINSTLSNIDIIGDRY